MSTLQSGKRSGIMATIAIVISALLPCYAFADSSSSRRTVLLPVKRTVISSQVDSSVLKYNVRMGERFHKNHLIVLLDNSYLVH